MRGHKQWLANLQPGDKVALKYSDDLMHTYIQEVERVTKNLIFVSGHGKWDRVTGKHLPKPSDCTTFDLIQTQMFISKPTKQDWLKHHRWQCDDLIDNLILEYDEHGMRTIDVGDLTDQTMMKLLGVLRNVIDELKAKKVKLRYP